MRIVAGLAPTLVALQAFGVVAPASAGTVAIEGSAIIYRADPGANDHASAIKQPDGTFKISGATAGPGCSSEQYGNASCPGEGITELRFYFGDGDDSYGPVPGRHGIPLLIEAGPGNDYVDTGVGSGDRVTIDGGPGDDSISGVGEKSSGRMAVSAGDGQDGVDVTAAEAVVDTGAGHDRVNVAAAGAVIDTGAGHDRVLMLADGSVDGGPGRDQIEGRAYELVIDAGADDDDVVTDDGDDRVLAGPGDDDVETGYGSDVIDGGAGDDVLNGGRGDDVIDGGDGDDDLIGERGDDTLVSRDNTADHLVTCGQGSDQLTADSGDPVHIDCDTVDGGLLRVGTANVVSFGVACPSDCSGRIALTAAGKSIGTGAFDGGRTVRPQVRLNARGRRLLMSRKRIRVQSRLRARDGSGRLYRVAGTYRLRRR